MQRGAFMSMLLKMKSDYINKLINNCRKSVVLEGFDDGASLGHYVKLVDDIHKINNLTADEIKDKVLSMMEGKL